MTREVFVSSNRNFTDALLAGMSAQRFERPVLRERVIECEAGEALYLVHYSVPVEDEIDADEPE